MLSRLLPPSFKISNIGKSIQNQVCLFPKASSFQAQSLFKANSTRNFSNLGQLFSASKSIAKKSINQYKILAFAENSIPRKLRRLLSTNEQAKVAEAENSEPNYEATLGTSKPKLIGTWLMICSGMIFIMVVLGGVTRLTESGLSITEWKPIVGSVPPRTQKEWEIEFEKYKKSPEYQKLNSGMGLEEFKKIFWMEWAHREWGRVIGLAVAGPFLIFASRGLIKGPLMKKCLGMLGLLGFQGALGWYMVKSGLDHKTFEDGKTPPRVSQYRLAAHLLSAIVLYSYMFYQGLNMLFPKGYPKTFLVPKRLKMSSHLFAGLAYLTAVSGAFVAGLDAGLIYNEFPLMGGEIIPPNMWVKSPFWKNFFENDTTVQFNHRYLGISTWTVSLLLFFMSRRPGMQLPPRLKLAFATVFGVATLQATLGITTLLTYVHMHVAATHQAGAMTLMTSILWLLHELKRVPKGPRLP